MNEVAKVKESFFMKELDDFFEEREIRAKRLKLLVRYYLSNLDEEYIGNNMKITKEAKKKKKLVIKTIYHIEGKGKSNNTPKLF